jgi:hypothetical protein
MGMSAAKWCTGTGSVILGVVGIGHETRLGQIQQMLSAGGVKYPLDAILKACWLLFGASMIVVAIIAFLASRMAQGRAIVLLCAALNAVNAILVFHYLGLFIGFYASVVVTLFLLVGGLLQSGEGG